MKAVRFLNLVLRGFGPFQGETVFHFSSGLNAWVAPNETGKSTLAAGLGAVLFGLPDSSQKKDQGFNERHFRNWSDSSSFRGQLELESGQETFRVARDFNTSEVQVSQLIQGHWQQLVRGQHNPNARRKNQAYQDWLLEHVGMTDRELFQRTFWVSQPLPSVEAIDSRVQALLSGSGEGNARNALESLITEAKLLTSATGDLGLTSRNGTKEGRLETLKREARELQAAMGEAQETIIRLQRVQEELAQAQERLGSLSQEIKEKEGVLSIWSDWQQQRQAMDEAQRKVRTYFRAHDAAQKALGELNRARLQIQQAYPNFISLSPASLEKMGQLAQYERDQERYQEQLRELNEEIASGQDEEERLRTRLHTDYSDAVGRPDLEEEYREYTRLRQEETRLKGQVEEAQAQLRSTEAILATLPNWSVLGTDRLGRVQELMKSSPALVQTWAEFLSKQQELDSITRDLAGYEVFAAVSAEVGRQLTEYDRLESSLAQAVEEARRRLERERRRWQEARAELDAQYSDVSRFELRAVEQLMELEGQRDRTARLDQKSRRTGIGLGIGGVLLGTGFLVGGFFFANPLFWVACLVILLGGIGLGRWVGTRQTQALEDLKRRCIKARKEMELNSEAALPEILGRLEGYQLAKGLLEKQDSPESEEWSDQLQAAQGAYTKFQEQMTPYQNQYRDVGQAYREYQTLLAKKNSIQAWMEMVARPYQVEAEKLADLPVENLTGAWRIGAFVAQTLGEPQQRLGQLAQWLVQRSQEFWPHLQHQVEQYETAISQRDEWAQRLRHLLAEDAQGRSALDRICEQIYGLSQSIGPFTEYSLEDFTQFKQAYDEIAQSLEDQVRGSQRSLEQKQSLTQRLQEIQEALSQTGDELNQLLGAYQGDLAGVLADWAGYRQVQTDLHKLQASLDGQLQAHQVGDVSDLEDLWLTAQIEHRTAAEILSKIEKENPALPRGEELEILHSKQQALTSAVTSLKSQREGFTQRVQELIQEQAQLQGRSPLNIAQAAQRLNEVEEEITRVGQEIKAVGVAHTMLDQAIGEFHENHREHLGNRATEWFHRLTGVRDRRIHFDSQFQVGVFAEDGRQIELTQLSQGAQDQLYLSLRMAIADLLSGGVQMPFIFDDPFLNWDQGRLDLCRQALEALGEGRQALLLSHWERFWDWGSPLQVQ